MRVEVIDKKYNWGISSWTSKEIIARRIEGAFGSIIVCPLCKQRNDFEFTVGTLPVEPETNGIDEHGRYKFTGDYEPAVSIYSVRCLADGCGIIFLPKGIERCGLRIK